MIEINFNDEIFHKKKLETEFSFNIWFGSRYIEVLNILKKYVNSEYTFYNDFATADCDLKDGYLQKYICGIEDIRELIYVFKSQCGSWLFIKSWAQQRIIDLMRVIDPWLFRDIVLELSDLYGHVNTLSCPSLKHHLMHIQ